MSKKIQILSLNKSKTPDSIMLSEVQRKTSSSLEDLKKLGKEQKGRRKEGIEKTYISPLVNIYLLSKGVDKSEGKIQGKRKTSLITKEPIL